ncbi:hypothetical protein K5N19_001966 [Vibrio parahaemolyticus]|nr:hypothetical protein [Vibrio parahaemolyticus]
MSKINDVIAAIGLTLLNGILLFIINRVFSDTLGQEYLGLYKLFSQLISYLNLADLGLSIAAITLLYAPIKENNTSKIANIMYSTMRLYKLIFVLFFSLGIVSNIALPFLVDINVGFDIYMSWSAYVFITAISYISAPYAILLTADGKYGYVQLLRGCVKIATSLVQILVLYKTESFLYFIFVAVTLSSVEFLVFNYKFKKEYDKLIVCIQKENKKNDELFKRTKLLAVHKVASTLVFNTDLIVISKFIGLTTVAQFASYQMIFQFCTLILNSILNVLRPIIGRVKTQKNDRDMYLIWRDLFKIFNIVAIINVGFIFVTMEPFIKLWMGSEYIINHAILVWMLLNFYISIIRMPLDIIKESYGKFEDVNLAILEGVMNLFLSIILVYTCGLAGVVIGTLLTNVVVIMFLKPKFVFDNCLNVEMSIYLKDIFRIITMSFTFMIIIIVVLNNVSMGNELYDFFEATLCRVFILLMFSFLIVRLFFWGAFNNVVRIINGS